MCEGIASEQERQHVAECMQVVQDSAHDIKKVIQPGKPLAQGEHSLLLEKLLLSGAITVSPHASEQQKMLFDTVVRGTKVPHVATDTGRNVNVSTQAKKVTFALDTTLPVSNRFSSLINMHDTSESPRLGKRPRPVSLDGTDMHVHGEVQEPVSMVESMYHELVLPSYKGISHSKPSAEFGKAHQALQHMKLNGEGKPLQNKTDFMTVLAVCLAYKLSFEQLV